jgi:hypothetical protein
VTDYAYEEVPRVRPKINGIPVNIPKFKQLDIIRKNPSGGQVNLFRNSLRRTFNPCEHWHTFFLIFFLSAACSSEELKIKKLDASRDENTLPKDVPNKLSVVTPHAFDFSLSRRRRPNKLWDYNL